MTSEFQLILPLAELELKHPLPGKLEALALGVKCTESEIISVDYLTEKQEKVLPQNEVAAGLECQFRAHFKTGKANFTKFRRCYSVPMRDCLIELPASEHCKVHERICAVDYREVCTYSKIGNTADWDKEVVKKAVDKAHGEGKIYDRLAKAVGDVCIANPFAIVVPCFRVIYSDGRLAGFSGNPHVSDETSIRIKAWLLEYEGRTVDTEGKVHRWKVQL